MAKRKSGLIDLSQVPLNKLKEEITRRNNPFFETKQFECYIIEGEGVTFPDDALARVYQGVSNPCLITNKVIHDDDEPFKQAKVRVTIECLEPRR